MKLQDILNSDKKIAVHCQTEGQAKWVYDFIGNNVKRWEALLNLMISELGSRLCMTPKGTWGTIGYSGIDYLEENGFTIIPAADFIRDNTEQENPVLFSTDQTAKDWIEEQKAKETQQETLIPFDYNKAKEKPELVRYRNGEKPLEWHYFEHAQVDSPIYSTAPYGAIRRNSINGNDHEGIESDYDLMLVDDTPVVEWYYNVYHNKVGDMNYLNMQDAIDNHLSHALVVIKITVKGSKVTSEIVHTY